MTRAGFIWAKLTRNESALARLGLPFDRLLAELEGQSIALVGNARALAQTPHGAAIDAADLVVRLNAAPMPATASHGHRTDWMAISVPVAPAVIAARAPRRIIWMTPRRKRLAYRLAHDPRLALYPAARAAALIGTLGARATTGALMIDMLTAANCARIDLYGFDFFQSLSLSGQRDATRVPHDFAAERAWVDRLMRSDPRLHLHR
ncbi:MAG: hypothetical protein GW886_12000 [Rhodobacterales bacterium]|nr:hypothetical protein [Rhodobacterales bacterium]NCT11447.1 hypothetical protein [Rhodobacterales bacterium]